MVYAAIDGWKGYIMKVWVVTCLGNIDQVFDSEYKALEYVVSNTTETTKFCITQMDVK